MLGLLAPIVLLYGPAAHAGDWNGFYLGINGGYLWSKVDDGGLSSGLAEEGDPYASAQQVHGGVLGGQIGLQRQYGSWVFGLEATFDKAWADGRSEDSREFFYEVEGGEARYYEEFARTSKVDNIFTLAGRIGHAWSPRLMTYVKAGYASAQVSSRASAYSEYTESGLTEWTATEEASIKGRHHGFVLGAGLETKLHDNIVLGIGYDYINLRSHDDGAKISYYESGYLEYEGAGKIKVDGSDIHMITARVSVLFGHEERAAPLK